MSRIEEILWLFSNTETGQPHPVYGDGLCETSCEAEWNQRTLNELVELVRKAEWKMIEIVLREYERLNYYFGDFVVGIVGDRTYAEAKTARSAVMSAARRLAKSDGGAHGQA
jgi:hypothetical protein